MQELEKILEEMQSVKEIMLSPTNRDCFGEPCKESDCCACVVNKCMEIVRKHMNDGWVPVEERLPENAKHKGALCPRYQLMTKYGVTEGWYNPDFESWYILIWFTTERYLDSEIDFERGAWPKIVRCENKVNDRHSIVVAWRPLPEPYCLERINNHDGK